MENNQQPDDKFLKDDFDDRVPDEFDYEYDDALTEWDIQ